MSFQDPSLWQWLTGGGFVAAVSTAFGYHKYMDGKIAKKADKDYVIQELLEAKEERAMLRGHIAKIFDQNRESEQKNEMRHRELLMHLLDKN